MQLELWSVAPGKVKWYNPFGTQAVSINVKYMSARGPCQCTASYISQALSVGIHKKTWKDVHSRLAQNSFKLGGSLIVSINWQMDKEIVVYLYNGIALRNLKQWAHTPYEWISEICWVKVARHKIICAIQFQWYEVQNQAKLCLILEVRKVATMLWDVDRGGRDVHERTFWGAGNIPYVLIYIWLDGYICLSTRVVPFMCFIVHFEFHNKENYNYFIKNVNCLKLCLNIFFNYLIFKHFKADFKIVLVFKLVVSSLSQGPQLIPVWGLLPSW